ncbi:MAG: PAS domain S-box protein, partial [Ferruginibacter sp.]
MFNKHLKSKIQAHFNGTPLPLEFNSFLESVNATFDQYENKISALEAALTSRESELTRLNNKLLDETADLKNTHAELTKIFNYVNEGFFTKDMTTGKYIHMSVGCEKIYGYTIDKFFANTNLWYEVIYPPDKVIVAEEDEILHTGQQIKSTYRIVHPDNSIRWIEVKAIPLMVDGKLIRIDGVVNDVTERKTAEKVILDNEERYRSLVEQASDAIFINSIGGGLIDANQSACVMFGYTKEEFTILKINDLIPPEGSALDLKKFNGLQEGEIITGEGNLLHRNKSLVPVDISSKRLLDGRIIAIVRNLSEQRKTEKILLASEEKTRLIMSAALDAIICIDKQDTITFWNPQAEKIFGWKDSEVTGRKLSDLIIPLPFRQMHLRGMEKYLKTGHGPALNVLLELSAINREGHEFPIELTVLPIGQGSEQFFCAFVRDISERKKSEKLVIDSERRYRTLFEQNLAGVYQTTASGEIITCNNAFAKMLGYNSPLDLLHTNAVDLYFTPGDREDFIATLRIEKKLYNYEVMLKCKDGSTLHILENISLFQDPFTGKEICDGIIIDITERKKAEASLQESEERYRSLIEQAADAIFINTSKGVLLDVNQSACDMLGYSKEAFCKMNLADLLSPEDLISDPFNYEKIQSGETTISERNFVDHKGHLIPVDISSKILSDGRILSIVRNISERRSLEKNNRDYTERFQRLSQATHDAIWDWNLVNDEVWWNEGFFTMFGYDKNSPIPDLYQWTQKI